MEVKGKCVSSSQAPRVFLWVAFFSVCASSSLAQEGATPSRGVDKQRLARGELLTRPVSEKRGSSLFIGGSAWQVIHCPPELLWTALHHTPRYRAMLPKMHAVKLLSSQGRLRIVEFQQRQGAFRFEYRLRLEFDEEEKVLFFRALPYAESAIREGWGYFRVRPDGKGRSLLSYGIRADIGRGLLVGLVRPVVHRWMLRVPSTVKSHVESACKAAKN